MTAHDHWKTTDLDAEEREREERMEAAREAVVTVTAEEIVAEMRQRFETARRVQSKMMQGETGYIRMESYADGLGEMLEWIDDGNAAGVA